MTQNFPRIAFLLRDVGLGGIEKTVVNLLQELSRYPVELDLILFEKKGVFLDDIPSKVKIIELPNAKNSRLRRVFPVVRYLRQEKPTVLVSQLPQFNVIAAIAKCLSGIPLKVVLVEHIGFAPFEDAVRNDLKERIGLLNCLRRFFYARADVVAAVSQGLAQELETNLKLQPGKVQVLHNPVVDDRLPLKAQKIIDHPWFQPGQPPVFLSVGRLSPQKDFLTLIQAFAVLRQTYQARLMILGEGEERQALESEITRLNLEADVSLPGFTDNPYAYMSKATAFVLSSRFEALPTVLIEALACGCQIISTDCPYGPDEILESGKYGTLVPIGNVHALAKAMEKVTTLLKNPYSLRLRAEDFTSEKTASRYLEVMDCYPLNKDSNYSASYLAAVQPSSPNLFSQKGRRGTEPDQSPSPYWERDLG